MDHCEGIDLVLHEGDLGEAYNIGTGMEMTNLEMVEILLDELGKPRSLIQHVEDRHGPRPALLHECQQAHGAGLGAGLHATRRRSAPPCAGTWTIDWWWEPIRTGEFKEYYQQLYGNRKVIG